MKRFTKEWYQYEFDYWIGGIYYSKFRYPLYNLMKQFNVIRIRKKAQIKVLFIIAQQGSWKTELLYQAMEKHPRFQPILGICSVAESPNDYGMLLAYAKSKGYRYVDLMNDEAYNRLWSEKVDIVFYQKPYIEQLPPRLHFKHHLSSLFCYVFYGIHNSNVPYNTNMALYRLLWQNYYENADVAEEKKQAMAFGQKAILVTGIPMFDSLLCPKETYHDPWIKQAQPKKRIIYAPHHSMPNAAVPGIEYSTFLDNADFMLDMAVKYRDQVQWAFKPHPILRGKLEKIWGRERTDAYYRKWQELENCQLENGAYQALFLYSDAMIHDCGSFTVEYHLTGKPVLYLVNGKNHQSNITRFSRQGYDLHYKAKTTAEIEQFIINVINDVDPLLSQRLKFRAENLIAPNGKTACENIIHAILGEEEYKNC
jgi:CDP-glycerol glycerophosphotransferase (TagB/SpsB family)